MTPHENPYRFTLSCNACGARAEIETEDLEPLLDAIKYDVIETEDLEPALYAIKCKVCTNAADDINERFPSAPVKAFTSADELALTSTISTLTRQVAEYQRSITGLRIAVAALPVVLPE